MNLKNALSLALVMIAVAAISGVAGAEDLCPRIEISSVEQPEVFDMPKYSATKTTDLKIHVVFPDAFKEDHVISLRFHTPAGHLYRQIDVPVTHEVGRQGTQTVRLPGYPYPVEVKAPEISRVAGESIPSVEVRFPVGGTSIATSSLFGRWQVSGMIDGVELRCFRPVSFGIVQ